jgi:hypothetical protein
MKTKSVFYTMLALVVVAFTLTGCPGNNKTKITGFSIKPTELTLTPGGSTRIATITEPDGVEVEVVWESSDTTIVTVSENGTVTALQTGSANITATCGEFKGVCAVTVKEYYETLSFTGAFVYDYDTTYTDKLDTLRSESWGDKYYVAKKVLCNVMIFSEGFYINEEGKFAGADKGAILEFEAPFYWAPAWANGGSGTMFVLGEWDIDSSAPDSTTTVGRPCKINELEYTKGINNFVQDYYVMGDESKAGPDLKYAADFISGAQLRVYEFHSTEEGYPSDGYFHAHIPDLCFGEGGLMFEDDYQASKYMLSVSAYKLQAKDLLYGEVNEEYYVYGARFKETESSIDLLDNKVYYDQSYSYEFGLENAGAPKRVAAKRELRPMPMIELTAEQKARIREQVNCPSVLVKK